MSGEDQAQKRFLEQRPPPTLEEQNLWLEQRIVERTRDQHQAINDTIERLALAAEFRDDATGKHTARVGALAARIARVLGWSDLEIDLLRRAAPLHDLGKVGISDAILLKPDKLTLEEFDVMKAHTTIGADILRGSRSSLLQMATQIALSHHERWDGDGYPAGIAGDQIPLAGRIVAVADVYDSLTHKRAYKRAWTVNEALAEISAQAGKQFDPAVVRAFLNGG